MAWLIVGLAVGFERPVWGAAGAPATQEVKADAPRTNVIQSGDKLTVDVENESTLSGIFPVNANGDIHYPLLGEVHAEGLSVEELKAYLAEALGSDYIINPQVQVDFQESFNKTIFISGQVAKPGNYNLASKNMTLLRMILAVGGFTSDASTNHVEIARVGQDGKRTLVNVDVSAILKGKVEDMKLEPGDMIFVGREDKKAENVPASSVAILGQIARPGNYNYSAGMTLIRLISQAGGFTTIADPGHVRIVRFSAPGKSKAIHVNTARILDGNENDIALEVGDVVVIPESFF